MTTENVTHIQGEADENRYLVFRVGQELLATPLLSVREIVEPLPYRVVPNPHEYYLGLSNLRGQIVGVVDLGLRLGLEPVSQKTGGAFLVFEVEGICMAGFATCVETVLVISRQSINKGGQIDMLIPPAAFVGLAKARDRLIPIIELPGLLEKAMQTAV